MRTMQGARGATVMAVVVVLATMAAADGPVDGPVACYLGPPDIAFPPTGDATVGAQPTSLMTRNTGATPALAVSLSGHRTVVAFDPSALATVGEGSTATLTLPIHSANSAVARARGTGQFAAHPLAGGFVEGNGMARGPRGSGPGVTYACLEAADIGDPDSPCTVPWPEPWPSASAFSEYVPGSDALRFDVTDDVHDGISAWMVVYVDADPAAPPSYLRFDSREAPNGNAPFVAVSSGPVCYPDIPDDLRAARVASAPDGLLVTHAGDSRYLYVVKQNGVVNVFDVEQEEFLPQAFIRMGNRISSGGERGLLSLAFHSQYQENGVFFVYYTNPSGDVEIARGWTLDGNPLVGNVDSLEVLLSVDQPFSNHNGGMLVFGPDGYLYTGFGDGGSGGDPFCSSQTPDDLLGKMIRIDVDSPVPSGSGLAFVVPADNPYANEPYPRNLMWASGLRNPWRWSFDRATGDMYIADVGQNIWEEINYAPAGETSSLNYGWNTHEANDCFRSSISNCPPGTAPCFDASYTFPVFAYRHSQGRCSITGGFVYRGSAIPDLRGAYVFADYCSGEVMYIRKLPGGWEDGVLFSFSGFFGDVTSLGEDADGELWITRSGSLYKIVQ